MSHRHRDCCCENRCQPVCKCGNNNCTGGCGNSCGNGCGGGLGGGSGIWILLLLLGCGGIGGRGRGCGGFGGLF